MQRKWTFTKRFTLSTPQRKFPMNTGVTRLDGVRCKKQIWRPYVRNWGLAEVNVLHWRKYLWHCWDFSALPAMIWRPRGHSAPEELRSLTPPSLRPCPWKHALRSHYFEIVFRWSCIRVCEKVVLFVVLCRFCWIGHHPGSSLLWTADNWVWIGLELSTTAFAVLTLVCAGWTSLLKI